MTNRVSLFEIFFSIKDETACFEKRSFLKGGLYCQSDKTIVRATSHLTLSMHGQRAVGKSQRNNYHHGNCEQSLTDKTLSESLIFRHHAHGNVKNRRVRSSLNLPSPNHPTPCDAEFFTLLTIK